MDGDQRCIWGMRRGKGVTFQTTRTCYIIVVVLVVVAAECKEQMRSSSKECPSTIFISKSQATRRHRCQMGAHLAQLHAHFHARSNFKTLLRSSSSCWALGLDLCPIVAGGAGGAPGLYCGIRGCGGYCRRVDRGGVIALSDDSSAYSGSLCAPYT
jgi:hypothetical protein